VDGVLKTVKVYAGSTADTQIGTTDKGTDKMYYATTYESSTGIITVATDSDDAAKFTVTTKAYHNEVLETTDYNSTATILTLADNCVIVGVDGSAKTTDDLVSTATLRVVFDAAGYAAYIIIL
jgi:hypothetical protein